MEKSLAIPESTLPELKINNNNKNQYLFIGGFFVFVVVTYLVARHVKKTIRFFFLL